MPHCVNASLFLVLWVFFGKNRDIFMAIICDMAMGRLAGCRYFREIIYDWIKTISWEIRWLVLHKNDIYCVLLPTNSSKQRKDNQCLARYRWCLLSVYHDTKLFQESESTTPPLGIRILPHFEKSKLDLKLFDDAPSMEIAPWKLSAPAVRLDLAKLKKEMTNPETYKQFFLQLISEYP